MPGREVAIPMIRPQTTNIRLGHALVFGAFSSKQVSLVATDTFFLTSRQDQHDGFHVKQIS